MQGTMLDVKNMIKSSNHKASGEGPGLRLGARHGGYVRSHYGLLWATGFVPAENGGAPEIFKTSWGLDRQ